MLKINVFDHFSFNKKKSHVGFESVAGDQCEQRVDVSGGHQFGESAGVQPGGTRSHRREQQSAQKSEQRIQQFVSPLADCAVGICKRK